MAATKMGSLHWRSVQESLLNLGKTNVTSVESIVRNGMEVNQLLRANLSSAATTALEEVDDWNKTLHSSLDSSLSLDQDAYMAIGSCISSSTNELWDLRCRHYDMIADIKDSAGKCLEDYVVDEPSFVTPRKRAINLPNAAYMEELRAPVFDELLEEYWESESIYKPVNAEEVKHLRSAYKSNLQALRDSRVPLTT